jgi:hypothetical protein
MQNKKEELCKINSHIVVTWGQKLEALHALNSVAQAPINASVKISGGKRSVKKLWPVRSHELKSL